MEQTEDRISELHVHIIYDILRRIGLKEKARTCVLSKTWSSLWRSRPDVTIDQSSHKSFMESTEKFIKFADDSLRPHVEQNLRVETLRLLNLGDQEELASHIDRWLKLVIKLNVRSLEICALKYSVPDAIYAAKTLTELSLRGCNFEIDNSTNKLQRLMSTCPLIRNLKISRCLGLQNLLVFGLVNLEKLELRSCEGLEKVEIQAPSLRNFVYVGVPLHKCPMTREPELLPCTIHILEYLYLEATTMTDKQFEYQLSKFSALEVLDLRECYIMKNIKVVSEKLKKFTLWNWRNLEQVNVLAPNLVDFDFQSGKTCMPFSTMDPSNLQRAKINFYKHPSSDDSYNFGDVDTSWYDNLQDFVQKFNYSDGLILVTRCRKDRSILIYEDPREIIVPPTRELDLCIENPSMYPERFTHNLMLWQPNIISIVPCRESKLVQVLQKTKTRYKEDSCVNTQFNVFVFDQAIELGMIEIVANSKGELERINVFLFYHVLYLICYIVHKKHQNESCSKKPA